MAKMIKNVKERKKDKKEKDKCRKKKKRIYIWKEIKTKEMIKEKERWKKNETKKEYLFGRTYNARKICKYF